MKKVSVFVFLIIISVAVFSQQVKTTGHIGNPFIAGYYADPSVLYANGKFYIYATIDPWGDDSLALWTSDNFKDWKYVHLNWPTKKQCKSPSSNESKVWAPSVVKGMDGRYHMFVSVGSEVYAGVSNQPEGPWRNVKTDGGPFIKTQKAINVHTIDAEAFLDDNGKAYLYWGSGWDWKDGHCFVVELNKEMDQFISTPADITPPNYFEAPYMLKHNGIYYLMYSEGKCTDSTYKVQYSTAKNPYGPWTKGTNSPILISDPLNDITGPGHHSILHHNGKFYIIYHRISQTGIKENTLLRELCIDLLIFDNDGNINKVTATNTGVRDFVKKVTRH